jgi:N-acetylglutamate synthase-like GNAT family acetyltransferase
MVIEFLSDNRALIPDIAEDFFQEWGYLRPGSSVFRYIIKLDERKNKNKIPLAIVAKSKKGEFLGTASLVENDMDTFHEFHPWISSVFVVPAQRNKGIGRELLKKLEGVAWEFGFHKIYLFTLDKEAFYSKLGWLTVKKDNYLSKDVTIMSKEIKNNASFSTTDSELKHG